MENKTQLKGLNLHLCEQTQEFMNDDVTERNFLIGLNPPTPIAICTNELVLTGKPFRASDESDECQSFLSKQQATNDKIAQSTTHISETPQSYWTKMKRMWKRTIYRKGGPILINHDRFPCRERLGGRARV